MTSIPLLVIYVEKNMIPKNTCSSKNPNVHHNTVYNSQDMEAA